MSGVKSTSPANNHYPIVPSDTVDLPVPTRGIRVDAGAYIVADPV